MPPASLPELLTFVVTCKGRLNHLKQTLPVLMAQQGARTIVVDASCPDGTANWVEANFPTAQVVKLEGQSTFNISRARNAGLAAVQTQWVCFIDADVCLAEDFVTEVSSLLSPSTFFTFNNSRENWGIMGTVVAEKNALVRLGGYDEQLIGYGGEDAEIYEALLRHGYTWSKLHDTLVRKVIQHSDAIRSAHYEQKNIRFSMVTNGLYRTLKRHVRNHKPTIDFDATARTELYEQAKQIVLEAQKEHNGIEFEVPIPPDQSVRPEFADFTQKLVFTLKLK